MLAMVWCLYHNTYPIWDKHYTATWCVTTTFLGVVTGTTFSSIFIQYISLKNSTKESNYKEPKSEKTLQPQLSTGICSGILVYLANVAEDDNTCKCPCEWNLNQRQCAATCWGAGWNCRSGLCQVCNGGGGELKLSAICAGIATVSIACQMLAGFRVFKMPRQVAPVSIAGLDFHVGDHLDNLTEIETPPRTQTQGVVLAQLPNDLFVEDIDTTVSNPLTSSAQQVPGLYVVQGRFVGEPHDPTAELASGDDADGGATTGATPSKPRS